MDQFSEEAVQLGAQGTPTYLLNGKIVQLERLDAAEMNRLVQMVKDEIAK